MEKTYEPGVYPPHWEEMPLEGKIWHLYAKWDSIRDDDMYELRMSVYPDLSEKRIKAGFYFAANDEHRFTDNGAVLVPADKDTFNVDALPQFLRDILAEEEDPAELEPGVSEKTFDAAVDKMFLFLDLLSCGYRITEYDWEHDEGDEKFDPEF
ncbi:MAG: hypothetical protein J6A21_00365 [Lentisphaeria bacterium]|nr:hypothetical protein [Lentisphaeria bacterium]